MTDETFTLLEDSCCSANEAEIHVKNTQKKFIVAHELGHSVSLKVDDDGSGCNFSYGAATNGCVGDSSTGSHGQLTKEYQSAAGCEGIADYYSALTWNTSNANDDCEYQRQYSLNWNIDGTIDHLSTDQHACFGDPLADSPDLVTDGDWLEDAVNNGFGSCSGTLVNRSTQYDWLRYAWDMVTIQGVSKPDFWKIWDDADPYDWNDTDSGSASDRPHQRMATSAATNGFGTEHASAAVHGLDH